MYLRLVSLFTLVSGFEVPVIWNRAAQTLTAIQVSSVQPASQPLNNSHRNTAHKRSRIFAAAQINMSAGSDAKKSTKQHYYPPSQFVVDEAGLKWRVCVAAAVLNSARDKILVGERIGRSESWQCPQGGVDGADLSSDPSALPETIDQAAARELYEEMGVMVGKHVFPLSFQSLAPSTRYTTQGTGSWMEKEGFVGQELHWRIFQCADKKLEAKPEEVCNLNGLNGEHAEFSRVKWESIDKIVDEVWEKKKAPYRALGAYLRSGKL